MTNRVKCSQCSNLILDQTARDNNGLCAPCFKRDNPSPSPYELQLKIPATQLDDRKKRNQLQGAMHWGNAKRIDELITAGTSFLSKPPSQFDTWLGEALSHGCNVVILEKLVAAGCDPNARSKSPDQTTPLEIAVSNDRLDAIHWLLENGANPNIGRPIVGAISFRKTPDLQIRMLTLLINAGADVNRSFALYGDDANRFTVLDWARLYEISPPVIEFLTAHGAKPCAQFNP